MKTPAFNIKAKIWLYKGDAGWHFITINEETSKEIKDEYVWPRKGFGSIPVEVTIGKTTWQTSVFPEKKGTYLLPIKKEVRKKENVVVGDTVDVSIRVRV